MDFLLLFFQKFFYLILHIFVFVFLLIIPYACYYVYCKVLSISCTVIFQMALYPCPLNPVLLHDYVVIIFLKNDFA